MKRAVPLTRSLDSILGQKSKVAVLRVLYDRHEELNGREIARRAGLAPRAANVALNDLARTGLVDKTIVGNNHIYSINSSNYLSSSALGNLFQEESALPGTIAREVAAAVKSDHVVTVAWFGSTATGKRKAASDFDLLVILRDSHDSNSVKKKLEGTQEAFSESFGIRLMPYVLGAGELVSRYRKGDRLIREIIRDAIVLFGKPLSEVIIDEP